MGVVNYPTLEHVAMQARPYPAHRLEGCETGLVLFAAAFLGHNDAAHFAEAGVVTTCVDIDGRRLREMQMLYPSSWAFITADAWEQADEFGKQRVTFDAVSCDTWTGDLMHRALASLDLWCSVARKFVTVTIVPEEVAELHVPEGWTASLYPRSERVSWLVLTRD